MAYAATGLVFLALLAGACADHGDPYGVRLGFGANDVRSRFAPGVGGTWTSAADPEPVLHWKATTDAAPIDEATFEFHSGMLVAETFIVTHGAKIASGPKLESTTSSVTARDDAGSRVRVRVLSRDCPTHRDEVRALLSGASSGR